MKPKIAVAPNGFRGSLSAFEAADCIKQGLQHSLLDCETILMPLADGGDGTLEVWLSARHGQIIAHEVTGPLGLPVMAAFGIAGDTALIEMARASGIELVPLEQRDPLVTTSFGTGELIRAAIANGAKTILVAVGGSATVDGGVGCLQALGAQLLDEQGNAIPFGGGALHQLARIDVSPVRATLRGITINVLCDVDNPLLGTTGAASVFGPQKGASPEKVWQLETGLAHYAAIVQRDIGINIADMPGTGAAGGLSAGLMAGAGATLVSGIDALIKDCAYDQRLAEGDIDLLITGEGRIDEQTRGGKAPFGIARQAALYSIPVVALAGAVTAHVAELQQYGILATWSLVRQPCTLPEAIENAAEWLTLAATNLGNVLSIGSHFSHKRSLPSL